MEFPVPRVRGSCWERFLELLYSQVSLSRQLRPALCLSSSVTLHGDMGTVLALPSTFSLELMQAFNKYWLFCNPGL